MKVTEIRSTVVGAPWRELTFVELVTDDGLVGLGEVRMVNKTRTLLACVDELGARYVVGADPFDVEALGWNVQRAEYGRAGEVAQSALSAFDVACWDLVGQALGVPVWRLLGGRVRDRIPAYANGWYRTGRDPGAVAEAAAGVVARGYRAMKVDPFGAAHGHLPAAELRAAVAILERIRDTVGPDVELMVEMHGRFTPAEAARAVRALEPVAPAWFEEPVPPENAAALRRVREHTAVPLATGERVHALADFREFFELGVVDVVQADLTHFGGFLAMKRLAGWADAYYAQMAPHNVCGPVGTMANVHFAAATTNYRILEHFNDFADPWVHDLVAGAPSVDPTDGCFALPTAPGLGVTLDAAVAAAHPPTGGRLRLFEAGWERRSSVADP